MSKIRLFPSIVILISAISFCTNVFGQQSYIIKFKPGVTPSLLKGNLNQLFNQKPVFAQFLQNKKFKNEKLLSSTQNNLLNVLGDYYILNIPMGANEDSLVSSLASNPNIVNINLNLKFHIDTDTSQHNDPLYNYQWALQNINAPQAWLKATGAGINIGIVDTGIDTAHADLKGSLWINSGEDLNGNGRFDPWSSDSVIDGVRGDLDGIDNDGNGFVDDVIGYDFVNQRTASIGTNTPSPFPNDENGHGTLVAGVIAASNNNGIGVSGIAYNSKIAILRAFDLNGEAQADNIAQAILYGAMNHIRILNFSFGDNFSMPILHDAVAFAASMGCFMSASAGNENSNDTHYPSDLDGVTSVGWSNQDNHRNAQSNYGQHLALLAPGSNIYSTSFDGSYRQASGTSLSAPMVSAAAALLLQIDSTLSPNDIEGILKASATDVYSKGWDEQSGAGILNIGAAVNMVGRTNLSFDYPKNEQVFDKSKTDSFPVIASAVTPLFDSYQILIGEGQNPDNWDIVQDSVFTQALNDTVCHVNLNSLDDSTYILRILVNLKNGKTNEKRLSFSVVSPLSPLTLTDPVVTSAWFNNRKITIVTTITNQPAIVGVKFTNGNSTDTVVINDEENSTYYHRILIGAEAQQDININAIIFANRNDGFTASKPFTFSRSGEEVQTINFRQKNYPPLGFTYLLNQTADFYGDGKQSFVAVDLPYGNWGQTKVYEFSQGEFSAHDSISTSYIPVGIGNTNGDGNQEVLCSLPGQTILFSTKTQGGSPFAKIIFADTISNNLTAQELFDVDKDGKKDIIAVSDSEVIVYSFKNGVYQQIATGKPGEIGSRYLFLGSAPSAIAGDFEGNGNVEICLTSTSGNVFIYKYSNGSLNLIFKDTTKFSDSPQILERVDVDGDGVPEILTGSYGSSPIFGVEDVAEPVWSFRILKFVNNNFKYIWKDYIYGVRSGPTTIVSYRNGISAGNVDGQPGDEIFLSAFPNLYIFKWDAQDNKMNPMWWFPSTYANGAVINDFDKNGINEFGFTNFGGTDFFEYDTTMRQFPQTPTGLDGWALNDTTAYLQWNPSPGAAQYEIDAVGKTDTSITYQSITSTTLTNITIKGLTPNVYYEFALRSVDAQNDKSDPGTSVVIFTHNRIHPNFVKVNDNKRLLIHFNGLLSFTSIPSGTFRLRSSSGEFINSSSVNRVNDSIYQAEFPEIKPWDYRLFCSEFRDYYNSPSLNDSSITIHIDNIQPEKKLLYLSSLKVISTSKLILNFSEPVETNTSTDVNNYVLEPYGLVKSVTLNPDNLAEADLGLDPSEILGALGYSYTLTVKNVVAVSGNQMTTGDGNSLSFVFNAGNLENAFVYPNPIRYNDHPTIFFANLTTDAVVTVSTLEGQTIATLTETEGNGGVRWDGHDTNGNYLGTGIYLFKVTGTDKFGNKVESGFKKFAVVR